MWIQREAGTPLPEPIQGNIVDSLTQVGVDPTTNAASLRITKEINDNLAQTPITVGGETLSTIDEKLNFLANNIIPILDREVCNVFIIAGTGGNTNGSCVRKTDGTVVNGASATVTTEDFIIENYGTIKANKAGKYLIFGAYNNNQYVPSISIVDVNANDTLVNYQHNVQGAHTISVIIRLD